ncbi:hypothetical protein L345_14544, partial [Ophiophagus hannah]
MVEGFLAQRGIGLEDLQGPHLGCVRPPSLDLGAELSQCLSSRNPGSHENIPQAEDQLSPTWMLPPSVSGRKPGSEGSWQVLKLPGKLLYSSLRPYRAATVTLAVPGRKRKKERQRRGGERVRWTERKR